MRLRTPGMKGVEWIYPLILICVNPVLLIDHSYRHNKHDVHFAGFFPTSLGYMETSIGQGVMPAVKLAIRHVNKSPVVLPHNRIRMHWNNTAVSILYILVLQKINFPGFWFSLGASSINKC